MELKGQVLVVDDEEPILNLVRHSLEETGYQVDTASTCRDALARIKNSAYDLVILDLLLPDMNGFVLSQEIARLRPRLKDRILFISAVLFGQNTVEHLSSMGAGFLPKPFEIASLLEAVDKIAGQLAPS
jgi:two-component system, OmpR family, alkaline phosphatase synthesis response regulator PhoP